MSGASVKDLKEAFVTGHKGTSPWELLLVCISAPVGIWLYQSLMQKYATGRFKALIEALVLLFPVALCQTNLLYPWGITFMAISAGIALLIRRRAPVSFLSQQSSRPFLAYVTCYRSTIMYLTFVAILGVDFHVFPRRFAKTEVSGYGLMDLGAGSFVVSAGLVSARSRNSVVKENLVKAILRIAPLSIMGLLRFLTTKGLEYQEHASEYGIHWNFFWTLALLYPFANITPCRWESPILLLSIYQWFLTNEGLQSYVETGSRTCSGTEVGFCSTFFAANREGILGLVGYLSLFILAELIGKSCIWTASLDKQRQNLILMSICLWIIHTILVDYQGIEVSRRTTNSSFCVWTLAHNITILSLISLTRSQEVPPIFQAVNQHGLIIFVVANLLTGLVNISINTLEVGDNMALLIIFLYLLAVGGIALILDSIYSTIFKGGEQQERRK
mmetsp:Transcript_3647/g.5562  ORF Transcript_3647/g.5562 Transcript_3647/m.5562 type:complete len:445 (+) Transcript_3647:60-1394(+)